MHIEPPKDSITMAAESVSIYYACNLHIWDRNAPRPSPVLFDLQADVVVGHLKENDILSHHITAWSSLGAAISKCYSHWRYRKHTIASNKKILLSREISLYQLENVIKEYPHSLIFSQ